MIDLFTLIAMDRIIQIEREGRIRET